MQNSVLIINFGSKYTQLIARKVRALHVYCEIHSFNHLPEDISAFGAIILSDSPVSITDPKAPTLNPEKLKGKPLLGIGYGAAFLAKNLGSCLLKEYTNTPEDKVLAEFDDQHPLFEGVCQNSSIEMAGKDQLHEVSEKLTPLGQDNKNLNMAFTLEGTQAYGLFFHPEVHQTEDGRLFLKNFLLHIAKIDPSWTPKAFVESTVSRLKNELGDQKVVLGLSGGVDSTVTAVLLNKAIGKNLYCIFVNHGLLRKNEYHSVLQQYEHLGLNVKGVDASDRFLSQLAGISDPEEKRKIIGRLFIEVFEEEARHISEVGFLGQGTIYPDIIESVSFDGKVAVKSHHNVGGLPERMNLKVVEPLKTLFKDEVRKVGKELGIKKKLIGRHPFPGPGLAIRIIGEITPENVRTLQEVDAIFIQKLREWELYDAVWQAGAILLPINSVGVTEGQRTYEKVAALRAVTSVDGMTASVIELPYAFLKEVSHQIITTVKGVNRVVYDISAKPPATIEWE